MFILFQSSVPYSHIINLESWMITPGWPPLSLVIIEFRWSSLGHIRPRFTSNSVFEISSSTTNGQVNNQIKLFIKGSAFMCWSFPRILSTLKTRSFPISHIWMIDLQNFISIIVQIGIKCFIVPIKSKYMEIISKRTAIQRFLSMGFIIEIMCIIRSPM